MLSIEGAKGLVGYMFSYAKGVKCVVIALCLGPGGHGPGAPLDPLLECDHINNREKEMEERRMNERVKITYFQIQFLFFQIIKESCILLYCR